MNVTKKVRTAGSQLASHKWAQKSAAERRRILELVRAAKKRKPGMSDNFAIASALLSRDNARTRGSR